LFIYLFIHLFIFLYLIPTKYFLQSKFGISPGDEASIRRVVTSYIEGLAWVATYYHAGCGSWTWYYPYLYAPLASDLVDLSSVPLTFDGGRPFTPLLQLLSVLPPQSL
jgi:5'-3' exonuclease